MYVDLYVHSLDNKGSFGDIVTSIASHITTHEQAKTVSRKLKFFVSNSSLKKAMSFVIIWQNSRK
jgi:hypothetical protein